MKKIAILLVVLMAAMVMATGCANTADDAADALGYDDIDIDDTPTYPYPDSPNIDFCPWYPVRATVEYELDSSLSYSEKEEIRQWMEEANDELVTLTSNPVGFFLEVINLELMEEYYQKRDAFQAQIISLTYRSHTLEIEIYQLESQGYYEEAEILQQELDTVHQQIDKLNVEIDNINNDLNSAIAGTGSYDTLSIAKGEENYADRGFVSFAQMQIKTGIEKAAFGELLFKVLGFENYEGSPDAIFSENDIRKIEEIYSNESITLYPELYICH